LGILLWLEESLRRETARLVPRLLDCRVTALCASPAKTMLGVSNADVLRHGLRHRNILGLG